MLTYHLDVKKWFHLFIYLFRKEKIINYLLIYFIELNIYYIKLFIYSIGWILWNWAHGLWSYNITKRCACACFFFFNLFTFFFVAFYSLVFYDYIQYYYTVVVVFSSNHTCCMSLPDEITYLIMKRGHSFFLIVWSFLVDNEIDGIFVRIFFLVLFK